MYYTLFIHRVYSPTSTCIHSCYKWYALRVIVVRVDSRSGIFTLTLFRCGRLIHRATYFEDAGQRLPVREVAITIR